MDPITATLIAAGIGALGSVIGGYIGKERGYKRGVREGEKHSIEKFMDIYKQNIERAVRHLDEGRNDSAGDVARGFVDNVKTWRSIQRSFESLLNGLVADLDAALKAGNNNAIERSIRAIHEAYPGKRLAVETELQKSKI